MALLSVGCANGSGSCKRADFWAEEWTARDHYKEALDTTFALDDEGRAHENITVYVRLNQLEKYCYQTRIE